MSSRQNDMASTQLTTPEPDTHALATYLEKTDSVRTKVRAALSYPVFVLVFSIAAACLLLLKIVPTFGQIYADMGQKLPALTQGVLDASSFLRSNILVGAALIGLPAGSFVVFSRTRRGKRLLDGMLLRVPIFGPIVRKSVMSRVCRTLGLLVHSGVPILDALTMVRDTCGNLAVAESVEAAGARIAAGGGLASSFRAARGFPEMVLQLISTGEESGSLDSMVSKGADFYERQVDAAVQSITTLIEPVLIVVVGGMIGTVVLAMFLPIFHMGEAVLRGGFGH
jgi:type IV pilus assembly protein PilC